MFGTQHFFTFLLAGIALNLTPGQDTLYIIGRSLAQGRTAGIVSALGIGSGCAIHITASAIGLYSLLALFPVVFTAICWSGAVYLIYLGVMTWIRRNSNMPDFKFAGTSEGRWAIYRQGMTTNLLNPKIALFFLAFLPQFIDPVSNFGFLSFLFLGFAFLFTGTIWCLVVAICASTVADTLRKNEKIQLGFEYFTSLLFIGLGISIFWSHI